MKSRKALLEELRSNPAVSVLIVGGGVNGLGLFRELALQKVDCLLVERRDFVSGASSKSSRLIHGGLRYLENGEIRLVREALAERNRLLKIAPHYVKPLRIFIPYYSYLGGLVKCPLLFAGFRLRPGGRGAAVIKLGLTFYDVFSRKHRQLPSHNFHSKSRSLAIFPSLDKQVRGTACYWDARITQPERLCLELLRDATSACSRCLALNYLELERREGSDVILRDLVEGGVYRVRPKVLVNASGAWIDKTNHRLGLHSKLIGPTKGSHLVIRNKMLETALSGSMLYYEFTDGRICLALPLQKGVLLGTTDIPVSDPDSACCEEKEVDYLLSSLRAVMPELDIKREDVVHSFCGVRPLVAEKKELPGRISRGHKVVYYEASRTGSFPVLCLVGGKWTTFRALAEKAADRVLRILGQKRQVSTRKRPIGGGRDFPSNKERWIAEVCRETKLPPDRVMCLLERYGTSARELARYVAYRGDRPLESLPDFSYPELQRIVSEEYVVHLSDLVYRRTLIGLLGKATADVLKELADFIGIMLGWDSKKREEEIQSVQAEIGK